VKVKSLTLDSNDKVSVTVSGVYVAQTKGGPSPVVVLTDNGGRMLPIFIGPTEAASIEMAILRNKPQRPGTHDLIMSILRELSMTLESVAIIDVVNGIYIGRLSLQPGGATPAIDARPSDCIALAVRAGCPIYVNENVMNQYSIAKDSLPESANETLIGS
jgi:bifunctional DNase/RNase